MRQIEKEDITHGMLLRIYTDPGNTDLDYVEGEVDTLAFNGPYMRIEYDNWPTIEPGAVDLAGEIIFFDKSYRYFELENSQ